MMAGRYQGDNWVAGADLRDEVRPDGLDSPNWGMRNQHDWHMAAQTMGNLLLRTNPDLLIVVEAVNWWGLLDGARPRQAEAREAAARRPATRRQARLRRAQLWLHRAESVGRLAGQWPEVQRHGQINAPRHSGPGVGLRARGGIRRTPRRSR